MGRQLKPHFLKPKQLPPRERVCHHLTILFAVVFGITWADQIGLAQVVISQPILPLSSPSPVANDWAPKTVVTDPWKSVSGEDRSPPSIATRQNIANTPSPLYASSLDSHLDPRSKFADPFSRYDSLQIQSARERANQFLLLAQSNSPLVASSARENAKYAEQWAGLAETYRSLFFRVRDATSKVQTTTRDLEDVRAKLAQFGLTPTIGMLLRHKKEQLDNLQTISSESLFATKALAASRQKQLEIELVRYDGSDPARQSAQLLSESGVGSTHYDYANLDSQLQDLLRQRSYWISALKLGYEDYEQLLSELDSTVTASVTITADYRKLISRHIVWIRSGNPISLDDFHELQGGMESLFDSRRSADLGYSLKQKWQADRIGGLSLFFGILLILIARWQAKAWLVGIGSRKRMRDTTREARKVVAGALTILVAVAVPGILVAIAYWLEHGVVFGATLQASKGLYAAALVALLVEMLRQLLSNQGYLDKHVAVELPRRPRAFAYLTLIGFCLILAAYLITLAGLIDHGIWRDSLARVGLMPALMLVAWTVHLGLKPNGGFLEPLIAKFGGSVIYRGRLLIYLAAVGFPLSMIALSALGYSFTANEIIKRAIITLVGFLVAATLWSGIKILAGGLWQSLTGTARPSDKLGTQSAEPELVTSALSDRFLELKHHLAFLCQCALLLGVVVGLGWLWIDVFPQARMGNPVVWTIQETVAQSIVGTEGQLVNNHATATVPVTALHLALAAATLFVSFQLAKLLPALFDALVLQRVSFDEGMEHLTLVLGRCLLFGAGCLIACKWIGLRWQSLQWLAVGLTIGLGFGLQDMVRNLFGGIVVLFEKPARLGDLITVGRVTGRVAAQKFRTTVLSDEEGREVIVPNKNFISEEVVNWMGAGRLKAIPIEVAVTRDQRPADICRKLQELVIGQPNILLAPAPQATLVCVAKASMRIEIRAWIEAEKDATRVRDSLLSEIHRFLKEKELLTASQPPQPSLQNVPNEELQRNRSSLLPTKRRRSA